MTQYNFNAFVKEVQDLFDYRVNVLGKTDYYYVAADNTISDDTSGTNDYATITENADGQPSIAVKNATASDIIADIFFLIGTLGIKYQDSDDEDIDVTTS